MKITIFGASKVSDEEYEFAVKLGQALAEHHHTIVNGGYCGTMEATAKGASERNGSSIGVIVPTVLVNREKNGNRYLTDRVICDTLNHRIETLIDLGDAYIILPGSLGTLNEFIELMTVYYIKNPKNMKPVFAFENPWKRIWTTICSNLSVYSLHPSIMLGG